MINFSSNPNEYSTVIFGPPAEAETMKSMLLAAAGNGSGKNFTVVSTEQDLANEQSFDSVIDSGIRLVLVHSSVAGFTTKGVQDLVHKRGKGARVVAVWTNPAGDVYDVMVQAGAVPYSLEGGIKPDNFINLIASLDYLMSQATQRIATAQPIPEAPVEVQPLAQAASARGGLARTATQAITSWSTKGGDGKSLVVGDLAYVLAMLGGRRTLLVDSDMNRGYFGQTMSDSSYEHAQKKNITSMAMFDVRGIRT